MAQKKFQELDLRDAFLFAAALEDPETCQLVLELMMGRPVGPVNVHVEHSLLFSKDFRYVRFDVYASDEMNVVYDMEMQNSHKEELPKRARYHQAELDATFLKPGQGFNELPASYVIFICTYDPFHSGLYRYTFEERCEETGECLGDGTCKIYLNTKGTNEADVPQELIHFLKYVETSTDSCVEEFQDDKVRKLHQKVESLKKSRRLEEAYMTMEELLADREAEGRAEGKSEGWQLMLELATRMTQDGLAGEIPRLKEDEDFCKSMLERYHLK
ncbi:MAG: Rpn family recombination-promoting nuclease/putative transposase [Hungatella hathewayi]|nr:Rpn family recombination-promoting nuclease/putative transposase [Hungatella hathewayi]